MHLFSRSRPLSAESLGDGVCFWDVGNHRREASGRLDVEWPEQDLARMVDAVEGVARTRGLDVVHWHYAVPFAQIAADVRRRLGPLSPTIVGTLHGTDVSVQAADLRIGPRLRREMATVDALTTVSRSHAALAATMLGLAAPPVVIPNFVDRYRFVPVPRERGIRPAIAHVSNFRSIKNPALAARVFAGVRRDLDAELWLVGDGEEMQRTRREVELHGLRRSTRFFGLRRDVETILPFADVLLVTSRFESFCLVALEAAACGVPVVAPRVGGIPDVVVEGETGLLYEVGNAAAAVQAVRRLLTDRELHARMRRAAVERATTFSNDVIVPRYELLYRTLIDRAHLADVGTRTREAAV